MKYIFVIAEDGDASVNEVLHWVMCYSDLKIIRVNDTDRLKITNIHICIGKTNFSITINDEVSIDSEDIQSFWYRRGTLNYTPVFYKKSPPEEPLVNVLHESLNQYYRNEWEHISGFIHYHLKNDKNIKSLNSYFDLNTNKLTNMEMAKKVGLCIPDSIVSNSINTITLFLKKYPKVITKPVRSPGDVKTIKSGTMHYFQQTNIFTAENLKELIANHNAFQPTLFQEYIEKEFEIRTFYLKGKMSSMAIFSQGNKRTQIDFRNYDEETPNRYVPFKLPLEIENKLHALMIDLGYDTGSFDIIYNKGQYIFLEVNTVGQFEWLSKWCNYFIEKKLALEILN